MLIKEFLQEYSNQTGEYGLEKEALDLLMGYHYPGNIRELKSIIRSAVNLSQGRPISVNFLPKQLKKQKLGSRKAAVSGSEPLAPLAEVEKNHILRAYDQMNKNKSQTAKRIGIGLNTLRRKLKSYGLE